jgi:hypothetical protein
MFWTVDVLASWCYRAESWCFSSWCFSSWFFRSWCFRSWSNGVTRYLINQANQKNFFLQNVFKILQISVIFFLWWEIKKYESWFSLVANRIVKWSWHFGWFFKHSCLDLRIVRPQTTSFVGFTQSDTDRATSVVYQSHWELGLCNTDFCVNLVWGKNVNDFFW